MKLLGGDRPYTDILSNINLFVNGSKEEDYLNPLYGFIWSSVDIAANYYNYSLNLDVPQKELINGALKIDNKYCDIIGSLIRVLFNKIPPGLEIKPSDPAKVDYMPDFTPEEFGIVIGLIYNIIINPRVDMHVTKKQKSVIGTNKQTNKPNPTKTQNVFKQFNDNKIRKLYNILKTDPEFKSQYNNNNKINAKRYALEKGKQFPKATYEKLMKKFNETYGTKHTSVEQPFFSVSVPDILKMDAKFVSNVKRLNTCFKKAKTPNASVILSDEGKGVSILRDIINVLLAVMWWSVNNLDGIKNYYKGLKRVVTSLSDLEIPNVMPITSIGNFTDTYIILYKKIIAVSVQLFDTGSSTLPEPYNNFTYSDCGETAIRNLLNICFMKQDNFIDIDKLSELEVKGELLAYYKKYNTIGSQSSQTARDNWSNVVSNLPDVNYVDKKNSYNYNINAGLDPSNTKPNILAVVSNLLNNKVADWNDLEKLNLLSSVEVSVNELGIGHIIFEKWHTKYKLHMLKMHFYVEKIDKLPAETSEINYDLNSFTPVQKIYVNAILQKERELYNATENWLYYIYSIGREYIYERILNFIYKLNKADINNIELFANKYVAMLNYFTHYESDIYNRIYLNFDLLFNANFNGYDLSKYGILFSEGEKTYNTIESIRINEVVSFYNLSEGKFPENLKQLELHIINIELKKEHLPVDLQSLVFGDNFNNGGKPISAAVLPVNLQSLVVGKIFDNGKQPLTADSLPTNLQLLVFGDNFNNGGKPISAAVLPVNLQSLVFGKFFNNGNQPLTVDSLPTNLQSLSFGRFFNNGNQPLTVDSLPKKLKQLTFNAKFNKPLDQNSLPPELEKLKIISEQTTEIFLNGGRPIAKGVCRKK